jgi:carbon-monoxide dehydrogenase small subunit
MSTLVSGAEFSLSVNGTQRSVKAAPMTRLLDVLRSDLLLTGAKEGCGEGECGACAVVIDGKVINSCLVPLASVAGSQITTIEGLRGKAADSVKLAFAECNAAQCGICTPGMVITATNLLEQNSAPTVDTIKESLSGNLCRCTGYTRIIDAVVQAADSIRRSK